MLSLEKIDIERQLHETRLKKRLEEIKIREQLIELDDEYEG
jgi:hypothetical protein